MMKNLYPRVLLLVLSWPMCCIAQLPSIKWEKNLGGSGYDYAYTLRQTFDGGYIIGGGSNSKDGYITGNHGNYDAWIAKLSATGTLEWQQSWGGGDTDVCESIVQTTDSGYIMVASTRSNDGNVSGNHGGRDIWVVKLSKAGALQWHRTLGGSGDDHAASVQQTTDSGYFITGYTTSNDGDITAAKGGTDLWAVKLSKTSAIEWQKSCGGSGEDFATAGLQTKEGNYIVSGYSTSNDGDVSGNHGGQDFWVVQFSSSGSIMWQRSLGGSNSDFANTVAQDADGGYVVAGGSNSTDGDIAHNIGKGDGWIVKLSATGSPEWQTSIGGNRDDAINSIQHTADGGYLASGFITSNLDATFMGSTDFWLAKIAATGTQVWQRSMGSLGIDVATCAQPTTDSGYIIGGYSFYQGRDVKYNAGHCDYWIVKLENRDFNAVIALSQNEAITVSPNPTTGELFIKSVDNLSIKVYNLLGQLATAAINSDHISIATFPSGIYIVKLYDEQGVLLKQEKVVKQ